MRRLIIPSLLVLLLIVLTLPPRLAVAPKPRNYTDIGTLMKVNRKVVQTDAERSDQLCRSQCSIHLKRTVNALPKEHPLGIREELDALRREHPHMRRLIWTERNSPLASGISSGALDEHTAKLAKTYLIKAKISADRGKPYISKTFGSGTDTFFVLAEPAAGGSSSIIGVVRRDLHNEIAAQQQRNLGLTRYNGGSAIKSVHSESLPQQKSRGTSPSSGISHYHDNDIVVKFRQPPTDSDLNRIKTDIGAKDIRKLGYTYVFTAERMNTDRLANYFRAWNVEYAEPHFLYMSNETGAARPTAVQEPNDSLYSKYQWNLPIIATESGWRLDRGSSKVIVGVVDTGVDLSHPDLQGHLLTGLNVVNGKKPPQDDVGHGTHVAGVISALVNNSEGVAGMTWYNPILPVKVLDETGAGNTYSVAQGIIWATDHGAKVINMSLGNYADANFLHDAIRYAFDKDVVLVAAGGNDNTDRPSYPAAYPEVMAVAATDSNLEKASFSNYGDYIDVAAPGVNIASTYKGNQYAALSGTSMASPHVTALAALIRSANPKLKNTEVMDIIRKSAVDLGDAGADPYYGSGEIDVAHALRMALPDIAGPGGAEQGKQQPLPGRGLLDFLRKLFG
jgi:thermitase